MGATTPTSLYVVALGSNRRGRHGAPECEVRSAMVAIGGVAVASPIISTAPLGPSRRRFANAAVLIESREDPTAFLARLKAIERAFGRRRGRRWDARVIDLDIILWSGGMWAGRGLTIPHPQFRHRDFVLGPLASIVPDWRDPLSGRSIAQLRACLGKKRPMRS